MVSKFTRAFKGPLLTSVPTYYPIFPKLLGLSIVCSPFSVLIRILLLCGGRGISALVLDTHLSSFPFFGRVDISGEVGQKSPVKWFK